MIEIGGLITWLKNWFYDKDEIDDLIGDAITYINQ